MQSKNLTYRGVVQSWNCDAYGHLNAGCYGRIFDDANSGLLQSLGFSVLDGIARDIGWAEVRLELDYCNELTAGAVVNVTSQVIAVGQSSMTVHHRLEDETLQRVAAEAKSKLVCFDLAARKSRPIDTDFRHILQNQFDLVEKFVS